MISRKALLRLAGLAITPLLFGACIPNVAAPATRVVSTCKPYNDSVAAGAPTYDQVHFALSADGVLSTTDLAVLFAMDRARSCAKYNDGAINPGTSSLGPMSFDCSGLVLWAYSSAAGVLPANGVASSTALGIPRTSSAMFNALPKVDSLPKVEERQVKPGDLAFYDTDRNGSVNHVAVVVAPGWIVHAEGTPYGLTIKRYSQPTDNYSISNTAKFKGFARVA